MGELIFDDIFKVQRVNPDGKKYDKVTRIEAQSEKCDMFMQLDVNTEIYPIDKEERFLVALSTTLSLEGGQKSFADKFEYIMHGKLYKISDEPEAKTLDGSSGPGVTVYAVSGSASCLTPLCPLQLSWTGCEYILFDTHTGLCGDIYVSFGGLQLMLKGDPSHCGGFELDQKLFLLMRKLT